MLNVGGAVRQAKHAAVKPGDTIPFARVTVAIQPSYESQKFVGGSRMFDDIARDDKVRLWDIGCLKAADGPLPIRIAPTQDRASFRHTEPCSCPVPTWLLLKEDRRWGVVSLPLFYMRRSAKLASDQRRVGRDHVFRAQWISECLKP